MRSRWLWVLLLIHVVLACGSTSTSRGTPERAAAAGDDGGGVAGSDAGGGGTSGRDAAPDATPDGSAGTAALNQLGAACQADAECASQHCADGVCCDTACNGLCAQCSKAGHCQPAADDDACPVIGCTAGTNQCVTYEARIATGRCKALGACKTQPDCGATPKPARTECTAGSSTLSLCDGSSTCGIPRVSCNGRSCTINSNTCCHEFTRVSEALTSLCVPALDCPSTSFNTTLEVTRTPIRCDQHDDCRIGQLCSLQLSFTSSRIHCVAAAEANQQGGFTPSAEVCQSPTASAPCSLGSCQRTYPQFPGYRFCAP